MIARDVTAGAVASGIRSAKRDWSGIAFACVLLAMLLASLGILVALLWDVVKRGAPVLADRGLDFLTAGPSSSVSQAASRSSRPGCVGVVASAARLPFPI